MLKPRASIKRLKPCLNNFLKISLVGRFKILISLGDAVHATVEKD